MSGPLGPIFDEAPLKPAYRDPASNTEFILIGELHGMIAPAQTSYEIAISGTPEDGQIELEHPKMALSEVKVVTCPAESVLEDILSDRVRAREPVRCLADQLFLRIYSLDGMVADLAQ